MTDTATPENTHDVVIVGSGPAGYTAAIYTARADLKPVVFTGSVTAGGELMNTTDVENYPGFPEGILGPDLMMNFESQARRFGADIQYEDVVELDTTSQPKKVVLGSGAVHYAKSLILSTGSAYRELGLEGEKRFSGHGVSWCATCDGFFFRDQHVAVVGGGDSAMEEALFLTKFASKVTVIHRRDQLRASQIMIQRAEENPKLEFLWNSEVVDLSGEDKLQTAKIRNTVTGEESSLDVTGLFVAIGQDPRTHLVTDQIDLNDDGTIKVSSPSSHTNVDGVFAAGDVIDGTYRQAITAAGTGCVAAQDVEHFLADLEDAEHERTEATSAAL